MAEPFQKRFDWPAPPGGRFRLALLFLGSCVLGIVLFLPALRSYFVCDDFLHVARVIEGGLPFFHIGEPGPAFLRPIIGLSLAMDYWVWDRNPFGYHLGNVLVHFANCALVSLLGYQLCLPGVRQRRFIAVGSGVIFLTLACHAEPVAWISGRTDVYATFFILLCLTAAVHALRVDSFAAVLGSLMAFNLALLSKESAIALPFLLALLYGYLRADRMHGRTSTRFTLGIGVLVCFAGYFLLRFALLGTAIGGYGARGHLRFSRDLLAQSTSRFAWRTFFPPLPDSAAGWFASHAAWLSILWSVIAVAGCAAIVIVVYRQKRLGLPLLLVLAFWAALIPVINIRIQWTNPEGERFLYLATVFASILLAWLVAQIRRQTLRWAVLLLALGLQGLWLHNAVSRWQAAGLIAENILRGIQQQAPDGPLVLVNKPDAYDGALIFRSGLPEGLRYFGDEPRASLEPHVLYAATLFQTAHGLEVTALESNTYRARATDPTSVMAEEDQTDLIETIYSDEHMCEFRFRLPLRVGSIFYYDGGDVKHTGN